MIVAHDSRKRLVTIDVKNHMIVAHVFSPFFLQVLEPDKSLVESAAGSNGLDTYHIHVTIVIYSKTDTQPHLVLQYVALLQKVKKKHFIEIATI